MALLKFTTPVTRRFFLGPGLSGVTVQAAQAGGTFNDVSNDGAGPSQPYNTLTGGTGWWDLDIGSDDTQTLGDYIYHFAVSGGSLLFNNYIDQVVPDVPGSSVTDVLGGLTTYDAGSSRLRADVLAVDGQGVVAGSVNISLVNPVQPATGVIGPLYVGSSYQVSTGTAIKVNVSPTVQDLTGLLPELVWGSPPGTAIGRVVATSVSNPGLSNQQVTFEIAATAWATNGWGAFSGNFNIWLVRSPPSGNNLLAAGTMSIRDAVTP